MMTRVWWRDGTVAPRRQRTPAATSTCWHRPDRRGRGQAPAGDYTGLRFTLGVPSRSTTPTRPQPPAMNLTTCTGAGRGGQIHAPGLSTPGCQRAGSSTSAAPAGVRTRTARSPARQTAPVTLDIDIDTVCAARCRRAVAEADIAPTSAARAAYVRSDDPGVPIFQRPSACPAPQAAFTVVSRC
jgi:hypothetical protein